MLRKYGDATINWRTEITLFSTLPIRVAVSIDTATLMKYVNALLCSFCLITLSACGGGSSGGSDDDSSFEPTDPNTVFRTFPAGYFTPGESSTQNCTGEDSDGDNYSAAVSAQTQAETTFLGVPAIPIVALLQLTNTSTGAFASNLGTSYASTSELDRRYLGYSDDTTTTVAATTSSLPQTVKIGDFGITGTYTDNAGNVEVKSWRVDDGGSGRAKLVSLSTDKDQFGNLVTSSITTDLIDTNGNVISEVVEIFYADFGVTLTLNCD